MKFQLKDVKPNPFRRIDRYHIIRDKVDALKESIESTEFWENIVGREVDGKLEIAYGHHRLAALKEIYSGTEEFDWRVKKLSDGVMIQMMARENSEVYQTDVAVLLESVRTAVAALAAGQISEKEMPNSNGTTNKSQIRYAPSFIPGGSPGAGEPRSYTATVLGQFLGMVKARGEASNKLVLALNALALEEEGFLKKPERFARLADLETAVTDAGEQRLMARRREQREAEEKKAAEERRKSAEEAAKAEKAWKEARAAKAAEEEAKRKERAAKEEEETARKKAAKAEDDKKKEAQKKADEAKERAEKAKREAKEKEDRRKEADEAHERAEKAAQKQEAEEERQREKAKREKEKRQAEEREEKEEKARELSLLKTARELVVAGRRSLAEKRHPDHGGSQEAMAEVNKAKELLERLLDQYEEDEL